MLSTRPRLHVSTEYFCTEIKLSSTIVPTIDSIISNNNNNTKRIDRDELIYTPGCISPKLEAAYVRFCRFYRTLILRKYENIITSVDCKAFCGDLLALDAIAVLKYFEFNVVKAVYYLQNNDSQHAWNEGRLNKQQLRVFENYISQYDFNSSITKVIKFKRRNTWSKEEEKVLYIYLFNFYESWKRTYAGSKVMKKFFKTGQKIDYKDSVKDIGVAESEFKDTPVLCQYCEQGFFKVGKTNKMMCEKCYAFFDLVEKVRNVSKEKSIFLTPIEFKWDCMECYEADLPQKPKIRRRRTASVTTCKEYCWNNEKAYKFKTFASTLKKKKPYEIDTESLDRDVLVYSSGCISSKLEAAYIRFCRFYRTLILRKHENVITSVDSKDLCGDLLTMDAIAVLKYFDFNVVKAVYYLQNNDSQHAWRERRLDKQQLRIFENYISQYDFNPSITKVINFKRRNTWSKEEEKVLYIYLFNFYESWKRTYAGSKVMKKNFKTVQRIEYKNGEKYINVAESEFKDTPVLCQYCEKDSFKIGKTNKMMCEKCYAFFDLVEKVRNVSKEKSITLSPIEFKWDCMECYEVDLPQKPKIRRERTRSFSTCKEYFWDNEKANKFKNFASTLKKKKRETDTENFDRVKLIYTPGSILPKLEAL